MTNETKSDLATFPEVAREMERATEELERLLGVRS